MNTNPYYSEVCKFYTCTFTSKIDEKVVKHLQKTLKSSKNDQIFVIFDFLENLLEVCTFSKQF